MPALQGDGTVKCADAPPPRRREGAVSVQELEGWDEIIDARSPSEYAEDRLPGAINLPVLNDEERARVGSLHKQASAFEAKKLGAALVSRNIAHHLETHLAAKPKGYRPLIYCWRGGNRSGSLATVLRAIGWQAAQLEGGYKAFRRRVIEELGALPERFEFRVICGRTGVGKSRFLRALDACGAQVLDLEEMAAHMGSVLGAYVDRPQPNQKFFETQVWQRLHSFNPNRPVFVESESRKIGNLQTPEALLERMRSATCLNLEADIPVRVALLKEEYAHFLAAPETMGKQLDCLVELQGRERIEAWKNQAVEGRWDALVEDLLVRHYDPAYLRSLGRNYTRAPDSPCLWLKDHRPAAFLDLAQDFLSSSACSPSDNC
ncbi:MAG: tRNA 2-selenouridine(34) synthase MnmH [Betaproteobacteria bacterium]|nr:tRNA 2-selenouridine(34) synthase MnmH [Betaproteobacteria bacterium]